MKTLQHVFLFLTASCLIFTSCKVQQGYLKIQETALQDIIVKQEIIKMIDSHSKSDSIFEKGYGYINLEIEMGFRGDTVARYSMVPAIQPLYEDNYFPPFYTFVSNKLVLLYNSQLSKYLTLRYDRASKNRLIKIIKDCTDPNQKKETEAVIKDLIKGKERLGLPASKKNEDYRIGFDYWGPSTEIYVLRNGKYIINKKH